MLLLFISALRVRQKMCGKGRPILMIGDLLCENVSTIMTQYRVMDNNKHIN